MNLTDFAASKAKGLVEVKRYGDSFNIVQRQFNAATGEEIAPQIATVSRQEVTAQRDAAQKTVTEANAIIAEFDRLTQPPA